MATVRIIPDNKLVVARLEVRTLSGTLLVGGTPQSRQVLSYKNGDGDSYSSTLSDESTGAWSLEVNANDNDRFRIVIVGQGSEYTKAFENVVAG